MNCVTMKPSARHCLLSKKIYGRTPNSGLVALYCEICAHRNPRPYIQHWKHSVGNVPADVVEIAIDALRAKLFQLGRVVLRGLVIESAVKAQLASQPRDLLIAAGHANRAATFDLRDLPDKRAHGSRRSRDNHCLARLRLA